MQLNWQFMKSTLIKGLGIILTLLFLQACKQDCKEKIVEKQLIQNIKIKHNNHLDTGIIGTPLLLNLLIQLGHNDLAYTIIDLDNKPSLNVIKAIIPVSNIPVAM